MTDKARALETIQQMPETATLEDILKRLAFVAGVREGLEQLDRGEVIPLEEVRKKARSWSTK
ncbi:MAG: hypothetical protein KIS92_17305 [Planctomycetota bacterium]|nr:hypothetical protein [Planctomycetota bacterium]